MDPLTKIWHTSSYRMMLSNLLSPYIGENRASADRTDTFHNTFGTKTTFLEPSLILLICALKHNQQTHNYSSFPQEFNFGASVIFATALQVELVQGGRNAQKASKTKCLGNGTQNLGNSTGPLCLDTAEGKVIAKEIQSPLRKGAIWAPKDQEGSTSNTIKISNQLLAAMHT